ncbi:MAG: pyridoxal phosphate-dependent aminotransferase, partial [Promethearchaeia archaeon]
MVVNPPKPGVSERSKIDSFIVMDLMRDAAAKQRELEASGSNQRVLHLEVGQPSTGAPSHVKQAASHALQGDKLGYTEAFGIRPLRERIARHYKDQYSVEITLDDVAITTGSSGAFVVVFTAAFDPGDRVAMAAPGYPCYRNILGSLGVDVVQMPVSSASNWQPTVEMLEELVKDGKPLKGLIIASPSNPTGTILSPAELKGICDFCARNGVRLISDEIYHGITIEGDTACALTYNPDAIVINSFSKYFSMTGWRLGWVVCKDLALKKALEA